MNTYTSETQQDPTIAVNANGQFLVAWSSLAQELDQEQFTPGIFAQVLNPAGVAVGAELHVNETVPGIQLKPAAAFAPDGTAWVVWTSFDQDGDQGGIYAHRLVPTGTGKNAPYAPDGSEFLVNTTTAGHQGDAAVAVNANAQVLVVWGSDDGTHRSVVCRLFDLAGNPLSGERVLGQTPDAQDANPVLATLNDGRFVVAWARSMASGAPLGIYVRIVNAGGSPAGAEFRVSPFDGASNVEPVVASDGDGRYVVGWMSSPDGDLYDAYIRIYNANGPTTGALKVEAGGDGYRTGATVAMRRDGTVLAAYNDIGEKEINDEGEPELPIAIRAQVYAVNGHPIGHSFRVNRYDDGPQTLQVGLDSQRAVWSAHDQLAVVWHGNTGDDEFGIGLSLFLPPTSAVAGGWPGASVPPSGPPVSGNRMDGVVVSDAGLPAAGADASATTGSGGGPNNPADFGFTAITDTGWYPPDPHAAVGPNQLVGIVNGQIAFFDKNGTNTFRQTLQQFWSSVGANSFVFDPQVIFDPLSNRFCAMAAEHANNNDDLIDIAVSDDDNPNGTWFKYRFNFTSVGTFIDFPNLGVGPDAFYVAADNFNSGGNYIYTFPKAPMLTGSAVTPKTKQTAGGAIISLGSMVQYDAASPAQYFVTAFSPGSPNLRIYGLTNPLGTQVLQSFTLNVGSFSGPPGAQQMGTSNQADTIDVRTKNGVVVGGKLYTCHNVSSSDGQSANVRWYEIDLRGWPTSGNNPTLLQSGRINAGTNVDTWFGSVSSDGAGNIAIAYNQSSPSQFIGVNRTYHASGDPAGSTVPGTQQQISTSAETGSRWGDYSGIGYDGSTGTFWNMHEYRTSSWRTWIANFDTGPGGGGSCSGFTNAIALSGPTIGFHGSGVTYNFSNGPPNAPWFFYYSFKNTGSTINNHAFDIGTPFFTAGTGATDAAGNGSFSATLPANSAGRVVYLEVRADEAGGASCDSNMITLTIF